MKKSKDFMIMGVINITPDSFSDGGFFLSPEKALDHCLKIESEGADYLDIGAESSRPGAKSIGPKIEWERLKPVLEKLASSNLKAKISIDSKNDETILRAADAGASMINNINGLSSDKTLNTIAKIPNIEYMAMHIHKSPQTMQLEPMNAKKAIESVSSFFDSSKLKLVNAGFNEKNIWLDPGIGFGKTDEANIQLMQMTAHYAKKHNIAIGVSRKSWIGRTLGLDNPVDRDGPSKMMELGLWMLGAKIIRTHEVKTLAKLRDLLIRDESCGKF